MSRSGSRRGVAERCFDDTVWSAKRRFRCHGLVRGKGFRCLGLVRKEAFSMSWSGPLRGVAARCLDVTV